MTADPFSAHMEAVARRLWGDPNPTFSTKEELRFGKHGSKSVDLRKGTFFDHEAKEGGGVLALIARETAASGASAVEWLRHELGIVIETDRPKPKERIVATYDYRDANGDLVFQVVRYEPKTFRQRKPDGAGWSWSVKGVRQVPYRLPELIEAIGLEQTVFIVEGEKDVEGLAKLGVAATCNAGGAGKWPADFAEYFRGADVVILPDNDDAGRSHRDIVGQSLRGVAKRVRILELPNLPPKGDASDWLSQGGDIVELLSLVETSTRDWTPGPPASRFGAIAWSDMDHVELRQDFLVEDLMFCGDIGMFYGASGSGKSFLAVDMGLSIARGVPFLGKATRKGSVLYQAGEGGKGLLKRLKAYRQHHDLWRTDVPFVLLPERLDLFSQDGNCDAFIEEALAWKTVLPEPLACIVIDTFSTASPGANENDSADMSRLIGAGQRINKVTGAAVVWVHHKNAAGDRERGHTSFRANIDTAMEVLREEDTNVRTLRLAKLKDGEDGIKISFELQSVTIGAYDDGKPITSCVVVPAQAGDPRTGKKKLAAGQSKFLKILDDAILHRGGVLPSGERIPYNQEGVEWSHFRDFYISVNGQSHADDAIRQALKRDGDILFSTGMIDRHDRWIWITQKGRAFL